MDLVEKYIGEARIKDSDIKVGSKFTLPNGETIEIIRLFKEKRNSNEDWVEFNRSGGTHQQGKMETGLKELRIFLSNWKATKK
jgi:hypothetical protein